MEQVRKTVGNPKHVVEGEAGEVMWTYERRAIDIDNGNKRDDRTVIVFGAPSHGSGTVTEVRFE